MSGADPATTLDPPRSTSRITALSLVAANALPLWALHTGRMSTGDIFVVYWLENVAVWLITIVKVATAQGEERPGGFRMTINGRTLDPVEQRVRAPGFFALHYGAFTLVHGLFARQVAIADSGQLHPRTWVVAGVVMLLSHALSTALFWFRDGERWFVSQSSAMGQPYPRMLVLHLAIVFGFGLLPADVASQAPAAYVLVVLKTAADLLFHEGQHRLVAQRVQSMPSEGAPDGPPPG